MASHLSRRQNARELLHHRRGDSDQRLVLQPTKSEIEMIFIKIVNRYHSPSTLKRLTDSSDLLHAKQSFHLLLEPKDSHFRN